jgi:hypothetical protein
MTIRVGLLAYLGSSMRERISWCFETMDQNLL